MAGEGAGFALAVTVAAEEAVEVEAAAFALTCDVIAVQAGIPLFLPNTIETLGH